MGKKMQLTVLNDMCTFKILSRTGKKTTKQKGKTRA